MGSRVARIVVLVVSANAFMVSLLMPLALFSIVVFAEIQRADVSNIDCGNAATVQRNNVGQ